MAYIRSSCRRAGRPEAEIRLPLLKALYGADQSSATPSQKIDHCLAAGQAGGRRRDSRRTAPTSPRAASAVTARSLGGGKIPGAPPVVAAGGQLSPGVGQRADRYTTAEQFMAMLRTGKRPDGSSVSEVMPFSSFKEWSEVDIRALYRTCAAASRGG